MKRRNYWCGFLSLICVVGIIYLYYQAYTIYGGDAGDLVSAIVTRGIPHPPGYPLYTSLGILIDNIFSPFGTAAWRIGFLSSIPAIIALLIFYDLLIYLTKKISIALIAVLLLAFSYPFWLYSEVVEVFSLNNLFIILLLSCFLRFNYQKNKKYLYLGSFVFGLSLTHHHIILFLLPALIFIVYKQRKIITQHIVVKSLFLIFLGLTPYFYFFIASLSNPAVNWLGQPSISNFIQLITRSTYGTFKAGAFIAHQPVLRLLDIYGFANFFYQDFRIAGVIFSIIGSFYLFIFNRSLFYILILGFLSYLFFLFYASFPLSENFIVGTFERFVLPLYILAIFFITYGFVGLLDILDKKLFSKFFSKKRSNFIVRLAAIILFLYPLGIFILNFPKISILKNDLTAENFGSDLLGSVPKNSIVLISVDTPLFDSQYLYYTQKKWPDVKLIHFAKILNPDMDDQFQKYYPDLLLPQRTGSSLDQLVSFMSKNYEKIPIFSKQPYAIEGATWIPWGLLFRYYKDEDIPPDNYILSENGKLWSFYHDPLSGSLANYKNLLLSDIIKFYTVAHQEIGFWAAKKGYNKEAKEHILAAEKLNKDDLDSYSILAQVYIREKDCDRAQQQIDYFMSKNSEDPQNYLLLSLNYALCRKDIDKANFYQKLYEEKLKLKETKLQKL